MDRRTFVTGSLLTLLSSRLSGRLLAEDHGGTSLKADSSSLLRLYAPPGSTSSWLTAPPASLVEDGQVWTGNFSAPPRTLGLAGAKALRAGLGMGRPYLHWVGYGLAHPEWYAGLIVMRAYAVGVATIYLYHRKTGKTLTMECNGRLGHYHLPDSMWDGNSILQSKGWNLRFEHRLGEGYHRLHVDIEATQATPAFSARLELAEDPTRHQPLVASTPYDQEHFLYTHKAVLPIRGSLRLGSEELSYEPMRDVAVLDEFVGHVALPNRWHWGTFGAVDEEGWPWGVNLLEGWEGKSAAGTATARPEMPPGGVGERAIWLKNKLFCLGPLTFEYTSDDPMKPWTVRDQAGKLELQFLPEGRKAVKVGKHLFDYYQLCGAYRGWLAPEEGVRLEVKGIYGVMERGIIGRY